MNIASLVEVKKNPKIPPISAGDTVKVSVRIVEGGKERIQVFQGVIIKMKRGGISSSFTVRHVAFGIGVERTFPFHSSLVESVEVVRQGKVRRSRLYYLRGLSGKEARRKIKRVERSMKQVGEELLQEQPEEVIEPMVEDAAVEQPAAVEEKPVEATVAAPETEVKEETPAAPEAVQEPEAKVEEAAPEAKAEEAVEAPEAKAAEPEAAVPAEAPEEEKKEEA